MKFVSFLSSLLVILLDLLEQVETKIRVFLFLQFYNEISPLFVQLVLI